MKIWIAVKKKFLFLRMELWFIMLLSYCWIHKIETFFCCLYKAEIKFRMNRSQKHRNSLSDTLYITKQMSKMTNVILFVRICTCLFACLLFFVIFRYLYVFFVFLLFFPYYYYCCYYYCYYYYYYYYYSIISLTFWILYLIT